MMNVSRRLFSCAIVGGLVIAGGLCLCVQARVARAGAAEPTEKVVSGPSLQEIDLEGYNAMLESNRGKALMVTFWATWCEPCRSEFPMIAELAKKYAPQGLTVVGVSLDDDSDAGSARQFLAQAHPDFTNYRVKQGTDLEAFYQVVNPAWRGTMPHTIFYGRDGHVARYLTGARPPEAFDDAIRLILLNSGAENVGIRTQPEGE